MARKKRPWSLLSSHGIVLVTLARYGNITVAQIGEYTGLSRSTILHVLKDLRKSRMLRVSRDGRRNVYQIDSSVNFRHPVLRDSDIGKLVSAARPRKR